MDASENGSCDCPETLVRGERVPGPVFSGGKHDCQYTARRNRLIKVAARLATEECGEDLEGNKWTAIFAREMDRLSAERERTTT